MNWLTCSTTCAQPENVAVRQSKRETKRQTERHTEKEKKGESERERVSKSEGVFETKAERETELVD